RAYANGARAAERAGVRQEECSGIYGVGKRGLIPVTGRVKKVPMDRRRNMLIGIVAGVLIVGALSYATGLTKLIRSSFGSSAEYKSSESATAPDLATGEWINSVPLKLKDLRGR